ncbi:unnamed protein product [Nezara viridula]|uniref:DNA damage-binding protein 2 n=1 Tax=Nezara viridula TaxID=85310 RepID=A0A9P0MPV2_NEZVI|nr:unnamed protein product [Nezara viridula]
MTSRKRPNDSSSSSHAKETSGPKRKISKKISSSVNSLSVTKKFTEFKVENVVKCLYKYQLGSLKQNERGRISEQVITEKLRRFYVYAREDSVDFDRRITALQFHPKDPHILGIGSKSGQLTIRFLNKPTAALTWNGIGPGGSITYITFDPLVSNSVLISSIDGTVRRHNYVENTSKEFLNTDSFSKWYCSVNASRDHGLIVTGDTSGTMTILNKDLKIVSLHKVQKGKINSLEIPKGRDWLLASASLDKTVKIWDIRKIESKKPIYTLSHDHAVNSANFSQVDGNRLLTTDQSKELRVYKAPLFDLETSITHPHRQFQHMTPIKATWHPLSDLIVVGRYPDPSLEDYVEGEARTVDIISAETGLMRLQLDSVSCGGILNLNVFNANGEILASTMSRNINYWKARDLIERIKKPYDDDDGDPKEVKLPISKPPKQSKTKNVREKTKRV